MAKVSRDDAAVAEWMVSELERQEFLYQDTVVYEIESRFGNQFVYYNANGNMAILPKVLKLFREITGENVVWDRSDRHWRRRKEYDEPGRQQS